MIEVLFKHSKQNGGTNFNRQYSKQNAVFQPRIQNSTADISNKSEFSAKDKKTQNATNKTQFSAKDTHFNQKYCKQNGAFSWH